MRMLNGETLVNELDILFKRENVIYGAGDQGLRALESFRLAGIPVSNFCDGKAALWGKSVDGLTVISPEELNRRRAEKRTNTIIATYNARFIEQIAAMLADHGNGACAFTLESLEYALFMNYDHPRLSAEYKNVLSQKFISQKFLANILNEVEELNGLREDRESGVKLYVENPELWRRYSEIDYHIKEPVETQVFKEGMILPCKRYLADNKFGRGGACDSGGNFAAGHSYIHGFKYHAMYSAYSAGEKVRRVNETVVYCGYMWWHYGHMLIDTLSRLWWFVENRGSGYKAAFINWDGSGNKTEFPELFQMLGLNEDDIIIVNEPTRFDAVIVPDQASYMSNGYTDKALSVYNAIRDGVRPAGYEKVYLTRTKFNPRHIINEAYFENYFRSHGFEIIAPETLPFKEQVAIMAGAKEIATTPGPLQHQILFCQDGIKLTVLNRAAKFFMAQHWVAQARSAKCTFIDVYASFLPPFVSGAPHLFYPTEHWKRYLKDNGAPFSYDGPSVRDLAMEYITDWTRTVPKYSLELLVRETNYTLADMIINMHKYLCEEELDAPTKEKLRIVF